MKGQRRKESNKMGRQGGRGGGGTRKFGRDEKNCKKYRLEGRKEKNKAKRIVKEAKRQERFKASKEKRQAEHLKRSKDENMTKKKWLKIKEIKKE